MPEFVPRRLDDLVETGGEGSGAEHLDLRTGELWGNFPQTYSMVGLITSAIRLSLPWDEAF